MSISRQPNTFLNELELNKIEPYIKIIVNGYIRKQSDDNVHHTIPKVINLIILAFYAESFQDSFDPNLCGSSIRISNNNKTIEKNADRGTQTCYGKTIIPSTSIGTYIWKIKVLSGYNGMHIGIVNAKFVDPYKSIFIHKANQCKGCYAYSASNGNFFNWEKPYGELTNYPPFDSNYPYGDILTVKLELTINGSKLTYKINDNKEFCEYNNTLREYGLNYQFAVSLYDTSIYNVTLIS